MNIEEAWVLVRREKARERYAKKHEKYRSTANAWAARNREKIRAYRATRKACSELERALWGARTCN